MLRPTEGQGGLRDRGLTSTKSLKTQEGILWLEGEPPPSPTPTGTSWPQPPPQIRRAPPLEQQAGWFQMGMMCLWY